MIEGKHITYQFSVPNDTKLPPLQYAIREKNMQVIEHLITYGVSLVCIEENKLTMIEDEKELPLQLFFKKVPSGSENPLYTGFEGPNSKWIGSKLPHLPNPELLEGKDIDKLSDASIQEKNCLGLINLVECHCIQPFYVAFRQKLISNDMTLTNGMHISEFIAQNGTEELTMYYAPSNPDYLFKTKEGRSSMIESSIDNTNEKVLKWLVEQLPIVKKQSFPVAGEIPTQDEQVSTCLYKSLERCIESNLLKALQIILNHDLKDCTNIRFNYLYREENTLLQLISLKNRNKHFLETILKKLISIKDDNLTHIDKIRLIDWKNEKNDSVLHQIVLNEQNELLISLLQFDPDIQLVNGKGNTALHIAVEKQNNSLVEILVNSIKDMKVRSDFLEAQNTLGLTALHVAIDRESKDIAKTLLEAEAYFFTKDKVDGFTILHHAIKLGSEKGRKDMMEFVLDYEKQHFTNGEILYTPDKEGNMPIHLAIKLHYTDAVRILLERDAKAQLYLRNQDGHTPLSPLHYATLFDTEETIDILELLFKTERKLKLPARTILNERCNKGRTPLHLAISKGSLAPIEEHNEEVAVEILKRIFDYAHEIDPALDHLLCIDYDLCSILHHAVMANNIKILECVMRRLITEPFENYCLNRFGKHLLNLQDKYGRTALVIAIENENPSIFCELLNFFPLLHCRDKENQRTVLHHAIEIHSKNTKFFDQIRKRLETEEFQSLIRIMDKNHHTAFHLAIRIGNEQLVELLVEEGTKIAVEEEFGSDVYTVGADGGEGLDVKFGRKGHEIDLQLYVYLIAFKVGRKYIISTLPKFDDTKLMDVGDFGNDVELHNVFPEDHEAVVKSVVASKCPELIKKMLSEKMISIENAPETNLMYLAAQYGTKAVMQYLCEEEQPNFDYELQDNSGNTLVHCVAKNSIANIKTLKYILKKAENFERGKKEKSTFLEAQNTLGLTALHVAIDRKSKDFAKTILKYKADFFTKDKMDGFTILHHAIKLGSEKARKDMMGFVLDYEKLHFPNGEILYTPDKEGNMPIHLAIKLHYTDAVRILLERDAEAQLYLRNQDENTPLSPLHYATLFDAVETIDILELLFKTERDLKLLAKTILNERCNKGRTPLHLAISKGSLAPIEEHNEEVAVEILKRIFDYAHEIDPALDHLLCIDYDLCSILHHAVMANNIKILECVMRRLITEPFENYCLNRFGKHLLNLQDKYGRTALVIAIENENPSIFCELLNFFPLLHCRDKENQRTVLHHAIEIHSKNTKFFDQIRKRLETEEFQSLINIMDKNHHTSFHLAIKIGNEQLVGTKIAVEKEFGSDVYTVGADGGEGLDVKFGRKGHETDLQLYVYLIAFEVGRKYIISTLPKFDDIKLIDAGDFGKDVELHNVFPEDHEALVKSVVSSKCPELIKKMLSEKMISIENAPETNLMYLAAQYGTKAVMQYLCEEEQPDFDYELQDTSGNTLVHCVAKNSIANIKTLKYILKKTENFERGKKEKSTRKIINFTNNRNQSALQISINLRKFEFFIALINRGANVTEQNHQGNSILHVLILEDPKPFEGIKLVIEAILNNEKLKKKLSTLLILKNHDGLTVLQIAIMNCHNEIVKFLIKNKASVRDIQAINRNTVVHLLTVNDWDESDMESISIVLNAVRQQDEDKTIRRVRNIDLETPLHISVRDKGKNFLTKSLLDVGVPLEIYNRERNTVLHIAALNEDSDTLEIIMQHLIRRANTHQLADRRVEYMRELVRENKNKLMPISIPRKKVNLKTILRAWNQYHEVNMGDGRRGLLIHFAVYNQKSELVDGILESIREIEERYDIDYQNLLSSRDTDDMTPLHVAAEVGDEQVADLLIRYGADIQLNSARGTPVEIAMQKDHIHLALRLVKRGAKINKYLDLLTYDKISDRDIQEIFNKKKINVERRISSADCTVIHYAAKHSSVSRIALLLRNDIALTTSDRDGKRVLHYAVQYRDNYEVLNFFLDEAYKRDERKQRELERKSEEEQLEYEELYLSYMEALFYHDLDGITPVMLAASLDKVQLFRLLTTPKYEYILDTFDTCDPNENNVMHYLAKYKSIKVARYIVPRLYKYDVHLFASIMNDRNTRGDSPIDLARKRGLQEMVDLFIEHCDCEYFEACPDVVHRMVKGKDFHNFEKVLEKTVNQDTQNVQIATKLMDSNEEGAYPNFAFFNFHLDPLWHKMYKSNEIKYKYHPIVKFLIDEKLTVYKWWFLKLFLLYLFLFYIPFATALSLASSRCDYELFLYNTHEDRLRFLLEMYILLFTWVYMMNEVFEILGKYRYLETLDETTNDLRYQRRHHVQYYGDEESDKFTRWIQNKVKRIFFEIPTILKERLYRLERSDHFRFFPRFMFRAIYRHFCDTYNIIDFAGVLLLLSLFFFRTLLYFSKSDGVIGIHWAIQALTFSVFTLKFFKYTKMIPSLGIYIETLSNVLSRDVPRFTLVILIVLIGYTGSIQQVARTNKLSQCDKGSCSFSDWFNDDSIPFSPITTPLISGILFILDGGPSNYEGSLRNVSFLFSVVYLIFAFSIIVILLNVFIAQLSQTYSDINSKKDLLDFKADLALEYETQSNILFAFRSPITRALKRIMVQSIIIPVDVWKEYLDSYLKRVSESLKGGR